MGSQYPIKVDGNDYRLYKDLTLIPSGKVLEGLVVAFPDTNPNGWLKFERNDLKPASSKRSAAKIKESDRAPT